MAKTPDLQSAYALRTPDDSRTLYARWAETYDESFARETGYLMPQAVAQAYAATGGGRAPVLDVGAGTGLVGRALPAGTVIDALDISRQMLEVAARTGRYRGTIEADLTGPLDLASGVYGAVVSAGTFTHGHVGPDALDELLRIARQDAVFVLGVNAAFFDAGGFAAKLDALAPRLRDVILSEAPIYAPGGAGDHAGDLARIVTFFRR